MILAGWKLKAKGLADACEKQGSLHTELRRSSYTYRESFCTKRSIQISWNRGSSLFSAWASRRTAMRLPMNLLHSNRGQQIFSAGLGWECANDYSSLFLSLLMTPKSSSVVMSPLTSPLPASSRSSRRMILPERVLGS
jgi:hypothetical protein